MNVVIDLETTGRYPTINEIIQIGAVTFNDNLNPLDQFMIYVKPLKPRLFSQEAQDVNGLTLEFLADKPVPAIARTAFTTWLEDASGGEQLIPLGYNYDAFDAQFLKIFLGLERYDKLFSYRSEDVGKYARGLARKGKFKLEKGGLQAILNSLGIKRKEPHDAISDCLATLEAYKRLP